MAIGRLLPPKLPPHFSSRGFLPLTRRWVSSSMEDGQKFQKLPDSNASANKDIGEKGMDWFSFRGLLINLKQKITGNVLLLHKTSKEDETGTKFVSSQNAPEDENFSPSPSVKEESSATESVAGSEILGKRESASVNEETFSLEEGSEFSQDKVLRLETAERNSKYVSIGLLTEEASRNLTSSEEKPGKFQRDKGRSNKEEAPQKNLSGMFIIPDLSKSIKHPLRYEALSNSSSSTSTRESYSDAGDKHFLCKMLSDPVQKVEKISKENDKHRFSDTLQSSDLLSSLLLRRASDDQKRGDQAATEEKNQFGNSIKLVEPVVVSRDLSMTKGMDSLHKDISEEKFVAEKSESVCAKEEEVSEDESLVSKKQSFCTQATSLATTTTTKTSLDALSVEEHLPNKVLLRFLRKQIDKKDIIEGLSAFGDVSDVQELPSSHGSIYRDALVSFTTKSAVTNALDAATVMVRSYPAVIEPTSQEDIVRKIQIPDLIGDPDVPIALVKEPRRTVKVHPLPHDITSNQIKESLRFCRSDISKIIFGSSKTAVFVEFETEEGKERALAKHSVSVFDKQLFISRIDTPRTTVVRISNLSNSAMRDIRKLCVTYGPVKKVSQRCKGISDVYFKVSEWPNMLNIVNSLNGKEVDGMKLVVQPAKAIIPHEILKVLWEDPREKRYVRGVIESSVREIEKPLDVTRSYTLVGDLVG